MPDYAARLGHARDAMDRVGIDLLYLAPGANAQYLTGWRRNRPHFGNVNYPGGWIQGLFVGLRHAPILAVPRMVAEFDLEPGTTTSLDVRILPDQGDPAGFLEGVLREFEPRLGAIGIENRAWSEQALALRALRPDAEVRLASEVMAPLRMVKDAEELRGMQMGPGEERPLAMKASRRALERGNSLSFDFGSTLDGYCYDFGRSVYLGEPPDEYRRVHALVMRAAQVGIDALQDDRRTAEEVDALARQVIVDGGYGEWFRHRLGHGIGLDVHEPPYLDRGETRRLARGMCFTIEPSVFITGKFGARTEDVVVVGGGEGGHVLTGYRRDLQVIT
jgi:Xaa-Pro dipeptidase